MQILNKIEVDLKKVEGHVTNLPPSPQFEKNTEAFLYSCLVDILSNRLAIKLFQRLNITS